MGNISFGGLASGLDTNGIISQLIQLESRPVNLLNFEKDKLTAQSRAIKDFNTRLSALESAAFDLTQTSNILGRSATSSNSDALLATANASANTGSFQVRILSLATASTLSTQSEAGKGNSLGGIANLTDFTNETLTQINTNNRLKVDLTAGTFYVNGQEITVNSGNTLQDVFDQINTATGGAVTGSLVSSPSSKGLVLRLDSGSPITLGQGTSNFLQAFHLDTATYDIGSSSLSSTDAVNGIKTSLKLDNSEGATNVSQAIGSGTLTINGTQITYNASEDSLNDILQRINSSSAGVTATFSSQGSGQVLLTAKNTGPLAVSVSDTGNLTNALALNATNSSQQGSAAQLKVNGGTTQFFSSNTGIKIPGYEGITLDLKEATNTDMTVTVNPDTSAVEGKLKAFVDQYNSLVQKIDELTAFDRETQVSGLLIADSSINSVKNRINQLVFGQVRGLSSGNSSGSLTEIGLSTGAVGAAPGTTTKLELNTSKLSQALADDPTRVLELFGAEGEVGLFGKIKTYLDGLSNSTGIFASKQKSLASQISSIDDRIERLNKRLENRQSFLEAQFTGLELTLSRLQAQQSAVSSLIAGLS